LPPSQADVVRGDVLECSLLDHESGYCRPQSVWPQPRQQLRTGEPRTPLPAVPPRSHAYDVSLGAPEKASRHSGVHSHTRICVHGCSRALPHKPCQQYTSLDHGCLAYAHAPHAKRTQRQFSGPVLRLLRLRCFVLQRVLRHHLEDRHLVQCERNVGDGGAIEVRRPIGVSTV